MHIHAFDLKKAIYSCCTCHWHLQMPALKKSPVAELAVEAETENTRIHNENFHKENAQKPAP